MTEFSVVDVETTGLHPGRSDRILELAIVRLDSQFNRIDHWTTLVNPQRDVGPTRIHHVSSADVIDAPTFADIAGEVAYWLDGAITVAHNASFDIRFISAEFTRLDFDLSPWPGLCTMWLARQYGLGNGLGECCQNLKIEHPEQHHALADAVATAQLLEIIANNASVEPPEEFHFTGKSNLVRSSLVKTRGSANAQMRGLSDLDVTLPSPSDQVNLSTSQAMQYLQALDRVLEDRIVDESEREQLTTLATDLGLTSQAIQSFREAYLLSMVTQCRADASISHDEEADLNRMCQLLGIDNWQCLDQSGELADLSSLDDLKGACVCITGDTSCHINGEQITKSMARELIESHGLKFKSGISKAVDILVVADPDTQSGKAKKARQYGIRIMRDRSFWQKLGVPVD